jgi:hypothetical protein
VSSDLKFVQTVLNLRWRNHGTQRCFIFNLQRVTSTTISVHDKVYSRTSKAWEPQALYTSIYQHIPKLLRKAEVFPENFVG